MEVRVACHKEHEGSIRMSPADNDYTPWRDLPHQLLRILERSNLPSGERM